MLKLTAKQLLSIIFSLLFLSGCSEDLSYLFSNIEAQSSLHAPSTTQSTSASSGTSTVSSIKSDLKILHHPQSTTAYENQTLSLSVTAQSDFPVRYQWYKNNSIIAGANLPSYSVPKAWPKVQGFYHVVLKTDFSERRSLTARVNYRIQPATPIQQPEIDKPVLLINQPLSQIVSEGSPFTLNVSVQSDTQPSYQWFRGDAPVTGARSASYEVLSASLRDQGSYSVLVQNAASSIRSKPASITVVQPKTAAIELRWETPKTREDGTPLAAGEIQAYLIEYGDYFYELNQRVRVTHQAANRYVLKDISPGTLYLRIATIDSDGFQGAFSEPISVYIN